MNTRPILKRLFRVLLTSLIYSAIFFAFYYLLNLFFGSVHPILPFIITIIITLFYYDEITWRIRTFIDRNFYRRIFSITHSLTEFNAKLNSVLDYSVLMNEFIAFLKASFPDHSWILYCRWGKEYELAAVNRMEEAVPKLLKFELNDLPKVEIDFFPVKKFVLQIASAQKAFARVKAFDSLYYIFPMNSYNSSVGFLLLDKNFGYYLYFRSIKQFLLRVFNKTADMLENAQFYSEVKRKTLQNKLLLEIGQKISATLHLNEVLDTIIDSVKQMVSYDAAGIFLLDKDRNVLRRQVIRGYDENLLDRLLLKIDLGSYGWVLRNKEISAIDDVRSDPYYYEVRSTTRSQVTIPLLNGEEVMGIMALESDRLNHFTPMDVELLNTFAGQAVIAIKNAQLFEASLQMKQLESELVVASKVQKALMPERPPAFPGFRISSLNIPSRYVGGDFLDFTRPNENELGIAIGDVAGKGAPAAILVAVLYAGFKNLQKEIYPVVEVVARLNNLLAETTAPAYYATFFFGKVDRTNMLFTFTNAGHNPPILLHRDLSFNRLQTGGIVLGFLADQEYRQESVRLRPGDYIVMFSDGVTEIKNSLGEEFGDDRLIQFLKNNYGKAPDELRHLLLEDTRKFSGNVDLPDDLTLAILYVE